MNPLWPVCRSSMHQAARPTWRFALATLAFSVTVATLAGQSAPITTWEVSAGRDDFSEEAHFQIAPTLLTAESITEEKAAALQGSHSLFLRPFVAYDNGVLLVGVQTVGEITIGKRVLRSQYGPGDIQWRIDQLTSVEIYARNTPEHTLPGGATLAPLSAESPEALSSTFPFTAVAGEEASALLHQLVQGHTLRIRRKASPQVAALGDSGSEVRTFTLGESFSRAIDQIGLVFDSSTGRWILSPERQMQRQLLINRWTRAPKGSTEGAFLWNGSEWLPLPAIGNSFQLTHPEFISAPGKVVGEIVHATPKNRVRAHGPLVIRYKGAVVIPPNSPNGYPLAEMAKATRRRDGSYATPIMTIRSGVFAFGDARVPATAMFQADRTLEFCTTSKPASGIYVFAAGNDLFEVEIVAD